MTRMIIRSALTGALLLMTAVPAGANPTTRTETANYIGTTAFTAGTGCLSGLGDDPNLGGACFTIDEDETAVTVAIDDASPLPAGGDLSFIAGSAVLESVLFCDEIIDHPIPAGATRLIVSADSASGLISCAGSGGASVAGSITASFVKP